jgi:hypothetical protein
MPAVAGSLAGNAVPSSPARADLLGGGGAAAGLEHLPADQIRQRRRGRGVAALDEEPAQRQRGDRVHGGPIDAAGRAFTHGDHRQQVGVGAGFDQRGQRVRRLGEEAARALALGLGHGVILARYPDKTGPSRTQSKRIMTTHPRFF